MVTRGLLILGAFLFLEGASNYSLALMAGAAITMALALVWAFVVVISPLR